MNKSTLLGILGLGLTIITWTLQKLPQPLVEYGPWLGFMLMLCAGLRLVFDHIDPPPGSEVAAQLVGRVIQELRDIQLLIKHENVQEIRVQLNEIEKSMSEKLQGVLPSALVTLATSPVKPSALARAGWSPVMCGLYNHLTGRIDLLQRVLEKVS